MHRKPWDELTDLEKREAIARLLGWTIYGDTWLRPDTQFPISREVVQDWPSSDGWAFTEVWPKVAEHCHLPSLGYDEGDDEHPIMRVYSDRYAADTGHVIGESRVSWADAICRAAYTLISVPESKEIGATK